MAGHSHSKTVKPRKDAVNAKKTKIFTKMARKIMSSVKEGGSDVDKNVKLRQIIGEARRFNMPKDNIERAIKSGEGNAENDHFIELMYEAMVDGVAMLITVLTNNRNRTAGEVKAIFNKHGGSADTSVNFLFQNVGAIYYDKNQQQDIVNFVLENAIEGILDVDEQNENELLIFTESEKLNKVRELLEKEFGASIMFKLIWKANELLKISDAKMEKVVNIINKLEDLDDVQDIFLNIALHN